jgi:hypothetical protein
LKTRWKAVDSKQVINFGVAGTRMLPEMAPKPGGVFNAKRHFLSVSVRHIRTKNVTAFSLWASICIPGLPRHSTKI